MTGPAARGRVAVIGDLAGHLEELVGELHRLGADESGVLPDDLTVVQVGDLVHRGPDSDGVVDLVDHYLRDQPRRWVQLVGNHEAQYVREPVFDWPERIGGDAQQTMRRWWDEGLMGVAAVIESGDEWLLVTHAGLTAGFWERALDRPASAVDAARALDSFAGTHDNVLFAAGQMLGGGDPDLSAGPVWASAATELVPSWLGVPMPFSVVHGHSTVADWRRQVLRGEPAVAATVTVDGEAKLEQATLDGGRIIGVDPGHSAQPQRPWRSFELTAARVAWPVLPPHPTRETAVGPAE